MNRLDFLEAASTASNDMDPQLPKGRGRCFDIGSAGGCGVTCPAFIDGECSEPQEIAPEDVIAEHGEEDADLIFDKYGCFTEYQENADISG